MRAATRVDERAVERAELLARGGARDARSSCAGSRAARARRRAARSARTIARAGRARERRRPRGRPPPARASRPGATTASFSRAMSAIVGPSQRVCSSPTLVSTTTGARSTPVASWRPPRPASTTATSTPRRASSSNAAAVDQLELGHAVALLQPAVDLRRRRGGALDRGAERAGLEVAVADPDALGEARQVRREERARAHAVRLEQRGGHPDGRALAVRADDVDRAEALLRRAERGEQAAHALQAEAHAEQLEPEQVLLGALRAPASQAVALLAQPGELVALGLDDRLRRLGDEALRWPASSRRARSRRRASRAARSIRRAAAPRSTASDGSTAIAPPGHGHRRGRLAAVRATTRSAPAARRAPRCARSPRPPAARAAPPRARRRCGRASRAAPAPRRSRAPTSASASGSISDSSAAGQRVAHQQAVGAGDVRPDLLGDERDHRVRDRERLGEHAAARSARRPRCRRRRGAA